jgi:branched-chain amino acid transport system ATP-binding protein
VTLLQVDGASKRFGSLVAIDDVSLTIEPGELRAIIGPNGAGKTTFFNLVSGLLAPTAGAIKFVGRDITALPPEERVRRGMARTFQITEIFPELSVANNIRVAVEIAAGYRLGPGSGPRRGRPSQRASPSCSTWAAWPTRATCAPGRCRTATSGRRKS